jgi:hypothetical protein
MPCCLQCGWNVPRARKALRQFEYLPYVWIGVMCLIFVGVMLEPGVNLLSFDTVFFGALAAIGMLVLRRVKRGRALLAGYSGGHGPGTLEAATLRLQSEWEWLLKTSPPREFRLSSVGRRNLIRSVLSFICIEVIFALCVAGNYWLLRTGHSAQFGKLMRILLPYNIAILIVYAFFYSGFLVFYHRRARRLLAGGQTVMGRIVSFERSNFGSILNVEFPHPLGRVAKARGTGPSEAYFEGMTLPVFCNPLKLKDSFVLLKDADYEIIRYGLSSPCL